MRTSLYRYLGIIFGLLMFHTGFAQSKAPTVEELLDRYPYYLEESIDKKRFVIEDLKPIFERLNEQSEVQLSIRGQSIEGRPIYLGKYGHGKTNILFWSQMHGNESTATMALLDLFNFFNSAHPDDQAFLKSIKENFTLYFIPMLNPDGVAKFERRNAANIDLNRDAIHLASPEARLLKEVRDEVKPMFGFNLHDQSIYYRAGRNGQQVAVTFLAPVFDYEKTINDVRLRAMQLTTVLRDSLWSEIPNRMGVYNDDFEPRAFGDNMQGWGTSTILIESGGYPNDPEKQYLRKLNFVTLIKALESINTASYTSRTVEDYKSIPENDRRMMSLIIHDVELMLNEQPIKVDIAYQYDEKVIQGNTYFPSSIKEVGDLSVYDGFEEFSARNMTVIEGKWHRQRFHTIDHFIATDWEAMVREGHLGFIISNMPNIPDQYPIQLARKRPSEKENPLLLDMSIGNNPSFILEQEDDEVKKQWVIHNGNVYTMDEYIEIIRKTFKNN